MTNASRRVSIPNDQPRPLKWTAYGLFAALILSGHAAHADSAEDKAAADALFRAGRTLVKQGKFSEACPKLEASQKLDPATGTLLALGDCYESNGQTASAWTTFKDARAMARKGNDTKRAEEAERRAGLLEPNLAKILIEVPQDTRGSGVEVRRNGKLVEPAMFGLEVAIDPGKQVIDATAPGQQVWTTEVLVEPKAGVTTIRIPSLVDMKPAVTEYVPPKQKLPERVDSAASPDNPEASGFGTQRTVGLVVGGVGLAGIVVGSVFGVKAIDLGEKGALNCVAGSPTICASPEAVQFQRDGNTAANIANVGIGVGAAALVTGVIVFALAPKSAPGKTAYTWQIAPTIAPGWASISLQGAF